MEFTKNYIDLCREIDIIEMQLLQVEIDLKYWFDNRELPFTGTGDDDFGVIAFLGNIHIESLCQKHSC